MIRSVHNTFTYLKKLLPILLIVVAGFAVYGFTPASKAVATTVVKCYPNPATSFTNFEFAKEIDKTYILQVYSFVGKKMLEVPVSQDKIKVTLNDFYRGIYVFQLRDKSGVVVESGKFQVIK